MITTVLLSELYDQAKANYKLAEDNYLNTNNEDYYKEMCLYSGEMVAYGKLLDMLINE